MGYPLEWVTTCDKRFDQWIPWPIVSRNDSWGAKHDRQKNHFYPQAQQCPAPHEMNPGPQARDSLDLFKTRIPLKYNMQPKKMMWQIIAANSPSDHVHHSGKPYLTFTHGNFR